MEKEIWKDIPSYEGMYQVSNLGRVKSLDRLVKHYSGGNRLYKGRLLKESISNVGYLLSCLSKDGKSKVFSVHQLVAMTFLRHKPNGYKGLIVDHIDNNKLNNKLSNIQLITHRENNSKDRVGTSKYAGVSWSKTSNKWNAKISINKELKHLGYFDCELAAAKAYNDKLKTIKNK
jgi:hypothetical protein